MNESDKFCADFLRGQCDFKKGVSLLGQSEAYYRGQATQEQAQKVSEYFKNGEDNV